MQEIKVCTKCLLPSYYIYSGRETKRGEKIYVNDNGKNWEGFRCPSCVSLRYKIKNNPKKAKQLKREYSKRGTIQELGPELEPQVSNRTCRICSRKLHITRYFYCHACYHELPSDFNLQEVYGGVNINV